MKILEEKTMFEFIPLLSSLFGGGAAAGAGHSTPGAGRRVFDDAPADFHGC